MSPFSTGNHSRRTRIGSYLALAALGLGIVCFCSLILPAAPPRPGEYYYTYFFRNNFSLLVKGLFVLIAFLAGYLFRLNPWLTGICLIASFPLTALIEAALYRGSHNLIPFELAYHLWLALPSILAAYGGRYVSRRNQKGVPATAGEGGLS
jgi:hypothetical protein